MIVQNRTEQTVILSNRQFGTPKDGAVPVLADRQWTIAPGQIVRDVPPEWPKHPMWARLTGNGGPLTILEA